jgi:phage terminase large subunit-like protein
MGYFDESEAQRAVDFIQTLCCHTKGRWAGVRFSLIPWQEQLTREIFGTKKDNGFRQINTVYCEVPKKNGKSEFAAAIALQGLVSDREQMGEVYSAATDKDQAGIVFHTAAEMVRKNILLRQRIKIIDSRKRMVDLKSGSIYQALSRETYTKHGLNPSRIVFDELHALPTRELWDILVEGTDTARDQQLIFAITTAGVYDPLSICWEVREYARQVEEGIIEDPSFHSVIYSAGKDEDWTDEDVWRRVNPSLGHIFDIDKVREYYEKVKSSPARQNNFRRYRLNQWVNQISRWLDMDAWEACGGRIVKKDLIGRECYAGLDLSSSIDLTAFVLVFPPVKRRERWKILPFFFVPEDRMAERAQRDRVPYPLWARAKLINATPGNVIDYDFVKKTVLEAGNLYKIREIAFDPWGAAKLTTDLANEGFEMVEHRQGFKSMSPPMKELEKMTLNREFSHGGHKVLRWCADNLTVSIDAAENLKPDKAKARERIDGMVALVMALGRAVVAQRAAESEYERRGLVVI